MNAKDKENKEKGAAENIIDATGSIMAIRDQSFFDLPIGIH